MKVYVSNKDIEENDLNFIEDEFVEKYWLLKGDSEDGVSFDVYGDVGMVEIETLEQHEAEIRKPLEEEIKKIKSTRMPASIPDGVALHYKQENAVINKAKQEVINELLEWIYDECVGVDCDTLEITTPLNKQFIDLESLIQKLNEMKDVE